MNENASMLFNKEFKILYTVARKMQSEYVCK